MHNHQICQGLQVQSKSKNFCKLVEPVQICSCTRKSNANVSCFFRFFVKLSCSAFQNPDSKPKSLLRLSSSFKTKLILSLSEEDEDSAICTSKLQQSSSDDSDHESNRKMARREQKRPKTSLTTYSSDEEQSPKKKEKGNAGNFRAFVGR